MVALDALRANKLRAFLTALGVVIGSACIVLVVTVALTGRKFVIAQIEGVGSNLVWARYVGMPQQARALSYELTPEDLDAIEKGIPQVAKVAGTRDIPASIVQGGVERGVTLIGHSPAGDPAGPLLRSARHGGTQQSLPDHDRTG